MAEDLSRNFVDILVRLFNIAHKPSAPADVFYMDLDDRNEAPISALLMYVKGVAASGCSGIIFMIANCANHESIIASTLEHFGLRVTTRCSLNEGQVCQIVVSGWNKHKCDKDVFRRCFLKFI